MENVDYEIKKLLEKDLATSETEELQNEVSELKEENKKLKEDIEEKDSEINEILEDVDNYSIDLEQLIEYLNDEGILTDELKNRIEYFAKFINDYSYSWVLNK